MRQQPYVNNTVSPLGLPVLSAKNKTTVESERCGRKVGRLSVPREIDFRVKFSDTVLR